jgi:hypothetical protein
VLRERSRPLPLRHRGGPDGADIGGTRGWDASRQFTPLAGVQKTVGRYPNFNGTGVEMVDISLPGSELHQAFAAAHLQVMRKRLRTKTQYKIEHMYLLSRASAARPAAARGF